MKPRHWFFLVVFVGSLHLCSTKGNVLDPLIDKLSIPARVSTAIAIQNGIYDEKKSNVIEVMAEHINTPFDYFNKFLQQDFDSSSVQLKEYGTAVKNTPNIVLDNSNELVDALKLLLGMKQSEKLLKPGGIVDPSDKFKESNQIVETAANKGLLLIVTSAFDNSVTTIREVVSAPEEKMDAEKCKEQLLKLKEFFPQTNGQLEKISQYENDYKDYFKLVDLIPELNNVGKYVSLAGNFSQKFKSIGSFKTGLSSASKEAKKMKSAIMDQQKYSKSVESLSSNILLSSVETKLKPSEKRLTIGILGHSDLKKVQTDVSDSWFKQNFAKNQKSERLTVALKPLVSFYSKFDGISGEWTKLSKDETSKTTSRDVLKLVSKVSKSGEKVLKLSTSSFEEVSTCIEQLQPIAKQLNYAEFSKIRAFANDLANHIRIFADLMKKIVSNSFGDTLKDTQDLFDKLKKINKNSKDDKIVKAWKEIRDQKYLAKLADTYEAIIVGFQSLPSDMFYLAGEELDYDVIKDIAQSFEGTNIVTVMACTQQSHIDHMLESFDYIALTNEFKSKSKEFGTTSALFKTSSEVQKSFKKLISDTKSTKLSKEALELKSFDGFKDIPKVAENIGGGVHSIRSINDISSKKKSIMVLVNANVPLKVEVSRIKGSDAVYNDETRKGLGATVVDVEKFEKSIQTKPLNSISDVSTVVKEAMKIPGVQIQNSVIFKDIEKAISQNSNPEIKSTAGDFGEVGSLDLDFARHSSRLKAYVPALPLFADLTQKFLMQGMKTQGSANVEDPSGNNDWIWYVVVTVVVLVIAFFVLSFLYWYKYVRGKEGKKTKNGDIEGQHRKGGSSTPNSKNTKNKSKNKKKGESKDPKKSVSLQSEPGKQGDQAAPTPTVTPNGTNKDGSNLSTPGTVPVTKASEPSKLKKDGWKNGKAIRDQGVANEVGDGSEQIKVYESPIVIAQKWWARRQAQHKSDTRSSKFKQMPPIYIPLEPAITPSAPITDNIVLENVEYDPTGYEKYDIGSTVDDIEVEKTIGDDTILAMSESSTSLDAVPIEQNQPTTSGAPVQNQQDQPGPLDPPVQNQQDSSDQSSAPAPAQQSPAEEKSAPAPLQQRRPRPPTSPAPEQKSKKSDGSKKSKKSKNPKKQPSGSSKKSDKKPNMVPNNFHFLSVFLLV